MQFLGGVSKKKKFSIFQVLGTVYFAVCHIYIWINEIRIFLQNIHYSRHFLAVLWPKNGILGPKIFCFWGVPSYLQCTYIVKFLKEVDLFAFYPFLAQKWHLNNSFYKILPNLAPFFRWIFLPNFGAIGMDLRLGMVTTCLLKARDGHHMSA